MTKNDPAVFHHLYGTKKSRVNYYKKDFLDYILMILLCALAISFVYGYRSAMSIAGVVLCIFSAATFAIRHGVELNTPLILRRPQDAIYLFVYKLQNIKSMYFVSLGLLLLENFLIAATPNLPHHVASMRRIALWLFFIHFIAITLYRTVILADHLRKRELIREVLMQTAWHRAIKGNTNMSLEVLHAYSTGVLAHIILIAPWYVVITHASFSVVFLPLVCLINVIVHFRWARVLNAWFYRDHWLGHNSELEFLYLHGTHHDAIPSGLIAVAENGFLEGLLRHTIGFPAPFYSPVFNFLVYTYEIKTDIDQHQYIPGVFPRLPRKEMETYQHSTHHYGPLEPYSLGSNLDYEETSGNTEERPSASAKKPGAWLPDQLRNSIKLDEELTGFRWDNPTYRKTLSLWDKYQD